MAGINAGSVGERRGFRRGGLIPPWLKVVVILEELSEARAAGTEDDRADPAALRAVGHRKGGAHGQEATHHQLHPLGRQATAT